MHDLVIKGGTIVDGTGRSSFTGDIAVDNGIITMVRSAAIDEPADRVIDADGLVVTPGFVDVHTHFDAQVTWDAWLTPSSQHGVTTVVMGNCGVGFAPAAPDRHDWLIELMEGVEDIPGSAMVEGITWGWESFEEYLDALGSRSFVVDVGAQIAHGPLRGYVMGERGAANEVATETDRAAMAAIVERALRAGALGFSTSRTPIHRSKSGELVPGTTAGTDELFAIGDAMARAGHGVFQFAPEHVVVPDKEWPWMAEFARRTGRTVCVNLNQADDGPEVWREVLALLDGASAEALPVVAQIAGRSIGILMCLEGSLHPLLFHPIWASVASLPHAERVMVLRSHRDEIVGSEPTDGLFATMVTRRYARMFNVDPTSIDYEPDGSRDSVEAVASRSGRSAWALVVDHLLAEDGTGMIYLPFFNYAYGDLSMTHALQMHPRTHFGLSDAGAHCGAICDGGMPTFMLTHWVRDRTRGPRLPLEHVVHRQTQATAQLYGLGDRGVLRKGLRADITVFDLDRLGFDVPRMAYDLPAGGRRLVQRGRGYHAVFVGGTQTVADDEFTSALPGKLIRGPRSSSLIVR